MFPLADISGNDLIKWAFVFFFFVLPILRSVLDKSQKAGREERRRKREEGPGEYAGEPEDPDVWEQLLGGDFNPVPAKPEPVRAQRTGAKRRKLEPSPLYGGTGSSSSAPAAWQTSTTEVGPTSLGSLPSVAAPGLDPHESVTHLAEFHSSSELMGSADEALSKEFASLEDTTQIPTTSHTRRSLSRSLDWRLAIRTREILGAPVALRAGQAEIPGLR